ncbi:unnamed protein product [Ectocarpus sp. 12 AP-2014]
MTWHDQVPRLYVQRGDNFVPMTRRTAGVFSAFDTLLGRVHLMRSRKISSRTRLWKQDSRDDWSVGSTETRTGRCKISATSARRGTFMAGGHQLFKSYAGTQQVSTSLTILSSSKSYTDDTNMNNNAALHFHDCCHGTIFFVRWGSKIRKMRVCS